MSKMEAVWNGEVFLYYSIFQVLRTYFRRNLKLPVISVNMEVEKKARV